MKLDWQEVLDEAYNEFNELYDNICKKLERWGYEYIDDMTSEQSILEMIEANEYEFTSDGDIN